MTRPTFNITVVSWGHTTCVSKFVVKVGSDSRLVHFGGDGYWQWAETCLRNHGKNCSWTQALHDCLEGWHSCVLHTGDTLTVLPKHPDYERVRQLVEDVDAGRSLPTNPNPAPDLL